MKLYQKIKKSRLEKGLSLKELHRLLVNYFRERAITYRSLQRIEAGNTDGRGSSLHQISAALGISLRDLKKDTEEETRSVDLIKRNKRLGRYVFSEEAYADLLMRQNRNFMVMELALKPQGRTKIEQDPQLSQDEDKIDQIKQILKGLNLPVPVLEDYKILKFEKYVYCLRGQIACYIGKDTYTLRKGDGLSFESSYPHWFENISKMESRCLIMQNPRYL